MTEHVTDTVLDLIKEGKIDYHDVVDDARDHRGRVHKFAVQAAISSGVLIFCSTMIAVRGEASIFLPIVTSILGYWLPAPDYSNLRLKQKSNSAA